MNLFVIISITFIFRTKSQTDCVQYDSNGRDVCNSASPDCVWLGHPNGEGSCYYNPGTDCVEFQLGYECVNVTINNCCWDPITYPDMPCFECVTPSPPPDTPPVVIIGDTCYCAIECDSEECAMDNPNNGNSSPTMQPTFSPTNAPTNKKENTGDCAINGRGDCCCDRDYGLQVITFINNDTRTMNKMTWYHDDSTDPAEIICNFTDIGYGATRTCSMKGWHGFSYSPGRTDYESFQTDTYFSIIYDDDTTCSSFFHTSCSSDIVNYYDAKNENICNVKCTSWEDANPNRTHTCNNNLAECPCAPTAMPTLPPTTAEPSIPPTTSEPSISPTTNEPTTSEPTLGPTTNEPSISPSTKSPAFIPTTPYPTTVEPSKSPITKSPAFIPTTDSPTSVIITQEASTTAPDTDSPTVDSADPPTTESPRSSNDGYRIKLKFVYLVCYFVLIVIMF